MADYLNCVYPGIQEIYTKYYMGLPTRVAIQVQYFLTTLIPLELAGHSASIMLLIGTLTLLIKSKREFSLRNRIHICIELSLILQSMSRTSNRAMQLSLGTKMATMRTPDHISGFCESVLIVQSFSVTATFLLMLCEGIQLNIILTGLTISKLTLQIIYGTIGGILPVLLTLVWTIFMLKRFRLQNRCWASANVISIYWILRGTRLAAMIANLLLLINTIRIILLYKPRISQRRRKSQGSERSLGYMSRCVKVAFSLLPILGIVNFIDEIEYTAETVGTPIFCVLALFQTLLSSLQGAIVSIIYYKSDTDMRNLLLKKYRGSVIDSFFTNNAKAKIGKKTEKR